jgi:hypothetical protein
VIPESHPDPFAEAARDAARDAAQLATIVLAMGRVAVQYHQHRSEQERRAQEAEKEAERNATRLRWAPGNDRDWLRTAGLVDTATVWSAAVPYAGSDDSALSSVQNCERRLRDLHPYAMSRYDRLRADGIGPVEAMAEAVPLFARPRHAYEQPASPRAALQPGDGIEPSWALSGFDPDPAEEQAIAERQLRRGRWIVDGLQGRAWQDGRPPLTEAEQRAALESATTLPAEIIPQVVRPPIATATRAEAWKQDFPIPIADVLAAVQARKADTPAGTRRDPRQAAEVSSPCRPTQQRK